MAFLFYIENDICKPTEETLLISPYKEIWRRDKNRKKPTAIKELTYIEFMISCKKTNPYKEYGDEKHNILVKSLFPDTPEWKPDKLIKEGMVLLEKFQNEASDSLRFFQDVQIGMKKVSDFCRNIDLHERTNAGAAVYKPSDIVKTATDAEKLLQSFKILKTKVEEELYEEVKTKAGKKVSPFANPNMIDE